jgi:hypothetical protein
MEGNLLIGHGRGRAEIEITPEMIEAGHNAIASRWAEFTGVSGHSLMGEVLSEVFLAMWAAR